MAKKITKSEIKESTLTLTNLIVQSELIDEVEVFTAFKDSLYDTTIFGKEDIIDSESHFGGETSIVSFYILAIIAWVSKTLASEGLKITKIALHAWFIENKDKIYKKYKSSKYQNAIKIIEKYLEKEVGEK